MVTSLLTDDGVQGGRVVGATGFNTRGTVTSSPARFFFFFFFFLGGGGASMYMSWLSYICYHGHNPALKRKNQQSSFLSTDVMMAVHTSVVVA